MSDNNYYEDTPPIKFVSDVYDIMKDGDNLTPERLVKDVVDMLGKYLFAQKNAPENKHEPNPENRINLACWKCGHICYVNPETEQFCPHCGIKSIQNLSLS